MKILGFLIIILGVVLGAYVGFWLMFVGGIVEIIEAIRAPIISAPDLAIGILKILFSSVIGIFTFLLTAIVGSIIMMIFKQFKLKEK